MTHNYKSFQNFEAINMSGSSTCIWPEPITKYGKCINIQSKHFSYSTTTMFAHENKKQRQSCTEWFLYIHIYIVQCMYRCTYTCMYTVTWVWLIEHLACVKTCQELELGKKVSEKNYTSSRNGPVKSTVHTQDWDKTHKKAYPILEWRWKRKTRRIPYTCPLHVFFLPLLQNTVG